MSSKFAVMLDGGFVRKKINGDTTSRDINDLIDNLIQAADREEESLLRLYYYDAKPYEQEETHPLSGETIDFSSSGIARRVKSLIQELEVSDNTAVRLGECDFHGWELGSAATNELLQNTSKDIEESDIVPDLTQTGVDMRIGIDVATLTLRHLVDELLLVTGDSDFVPAIEASTPGGTSCDNIHIRSKRSRT